MARAEVMKRRTSATDWKLCSRSSREIPTADHQKRQNRRREPAAPRPRVYTGYGTGARGQERRIGADQIVGLAALQGKDGEGKEPDQPERAIAPFVAPEQKDEANQREDA